MNIESQHGLRNVSMSQSSVSQSPSSSSLSLSHLQPISALRVIKKRELYLYKEKYHASSLVYNIFCAYICIYIVTRISIGYMLFSVITLVYVLYIYIYHKVVLVVCGRKIKNSWLNPVFFYQSSKLPYAKILDT